MPLLQRSTGSRRVSEVQRADGLIAIYLSRQTCDEFLSQHTRPLAHRVDSKFQTMCRTRRWSAHLVLVPACRADVRLRVRRGYRHRLVVPSWYAALRIIEESEVVGALPEFFVQRTEFHKFPLPVQVPALAIAQTWHPRFDADTGHRRLRECIKRCTSGEYSELTSLRDRGSRRSPEGRRRACRA